MKLINQFNETVETNASFENVQRALIFEMIDHLDNNILDGNIYDSEAVVYTSNVLQRIKYAKVLAELREYINYIGWELV